MSVSKELTLKIFFDIPEASDYHWEVEGVHLVGQAMTISNQAQGGDASASGMPLYEIYSFFGKRITTVLPVHRGQSAFSENDDGGVIDTTGYLSPEELFPWKPNF